MYHEQSPQAPERQQTLSFQKWRCAIARPALSRTESKAGRVWQYPTFPTKVYLWSKEHISRPCGPIFLGISPDRSTAAPVYFTSIKWGFKAAHHPTPHLYNIIVSTFNRAKELVPSTSDSYRCNPTAHNPTAHKDVLLNAAFKTIDFINCIGYCHKVGLYKFMILQHILF